MRLAALKIVSLFFRSLPMQMMTNTDLSRLLKSEEIQQAIRAPKYVFLLALLSDRFRLPNTFAVPSSTMCCGILPGRRR